jgi:hypothetical protein
MVDRLDDLGTTGFTRKELMDLRLDQLQSLEQQQVIDRSVVEERNSPGSDSYFQNYFESYFEQEGNTNMDELEDREDPFDNP